MEILQQPVSWQPIALTVAQAAHIIAIAVWFGTMIFNLTVGFPLMKARSTTYREYADWMGQQGTRTASWLYLLIALTAVTGWTMMALWPAEHDVQRRILSTSAFLVSKHVLLLAMLVSHLFATLRIWPRVFFAVDSELADLFRQYSATILVSATLGTLAIFVSAYWSVAGA